MPWEVKYSNEAEKDARNLDGSQKKLVILAIRKVAQNPLPSSEGGYGKPLGNKGGINLPGYFKIELKKNGLRIIYSLERIGKSMNIIVISIRSDDEVYKIAGKRIQVLPAEKS